MIDDTDEGGEDVDNIYDRTLTDHCVGEKMMDQCADEIIDLSTSEQEVEPMMVDPPPSHLFPK